MIPERFRSNVYPMQRGHIDRVTEIKSVGKNKYKIKTINDFITHKTITLTVFPSGKSHARMTMEKNYCPKETMQYWYDCDGKEIKANSDRAEKKIFDSLP